MNKRFLVVVHLPMKGTRVSEVCSDLGAALRAADAYPTRPSVILSGAMNMLEHSKEALTIPPQSWLNSQAFLAHVLSIADLFGFKTDVIQNVTSWDVRKASE